MFKIAVAVCCLIGGATAGFYSGSYLTSQTMEKRALAHSCGVLDPKTLAFRWTVQPSVGIAIDAMPDFGRAKNGKR